MTRSSLANAFIVLARKPLVLLLLFPVEAFFPFCLLSAPFFRSTPGNSEVFPQVVLMLGMLAVMLLLLLVKAVVLTPPAAQLLSDGAADRATEPGWFRRGLERHWWKRLSVTMAESALTVVLYVVFQFTLLFLLTFLVLAAMPVSAAGRGFVPDDPPQAVLVLMMVVLFITYLGYLLAQFALETVCAYLFPALVGGSVGAAFKAVFSKKGMRKLPKLAGGRLLVGLVRWGFISVTIVAIFLLAGGDSPTRAAPGFGQYAWLAAMLSLCLFVSSYLSVYRNAFEFCVFQELGDGGESKQIPEDTALRMALTKNGE